MIISTTKSDFREVLTSLSASVPSLAKDGDIYGMVQLVGAGDVTSGFIKAVTTNRHSTVKVEFSGEYDEDFSICLPFRKLSNLIPLLSHEEIEFEAAKEEGWIVLKNGKSKHKIPFLDGSKFPSISYLEKERFSINIETFYKALKACNIATSKSDKASWKLSCIGLKTEDSILKLRSCDGTQFSIAEIPLEQECQDVEALIPQQAVNFLLKFVNEKSEETIDIVICENHLVLEKESSRLIMTLVDGVFPDIAKLILSEFSNDLTASIGDLKGALKRTQTALIDTQSVSVSISGNEINILAASKDGKALEVLECINTKEERIDFNAMSTQLIEFLNEFQGEVRIAISDPKKAIHFWPLNQTDFGFVYLSMPTV